MGRLRAPMKRISTHTLTWSVTPILFGMNRCTEISTHTLTWSVTDSFEFEEINGEISTHTLTWSVTRPHLSRIQHHKISTHTLTWSVTYDDENIARINLDFNSHAHVERDERSIEHA